MFSLPVGEKKIKFDRNVQLAGGVYGVVYKGQFEDRDVAVKRVLLYVVNDREEEAMLKLDHPNIAKLLYCESDNDFR